jgi:hypothetical protein
VWLAPALLALLLVAFFATGYAPFDLRAVAAVFAVLVAVVVVGLRTIRRVSVDENGIVTLRAPFRRIAVNASTVSYLAPALDTDFLELGYDGGHCKIIDDFDNLSGVEDAIARFNSSFRRSLPR